MANPGPTAILATGDNLLSARASIALRAPSGWELTAFGDNLTNEDGAIRPSPLTTLTAEGDRYRPRTVGLQLSMKF